MLNAGSRITHSWISLYNQGAQWSDALIESSNHRFMENSISEMNGRLFEILEDVPTPRLIYQQLEQQGYLDLRLSSKANVYMDMVRLIINRRLEQVPESTMFSLNTSIEHGCMKNTTPLENEYLCSFIKAVDQAFLKTMQDVRELSSNEAQGSKLMHDSIEPSKHIFFRRLGPEGAFFHYDNHKPLIFAATLPINSKSPTAALPHSEKQYFEITEDLIQDQYTASALFIKQGMDPKRVKIDYGDQGKPCIRVFNCGAVHEVIRSFQPTIHSGPFHPGDAENLLTGYLPEIVSLTEIDASPAEQHRILYLNRLAI